MLQHLKASQPASAGVSDACHEQQQRRRNGVTHLCADLATRSGVAATALLLAFSRSTLHTRT
jgi:hypothetical protein